MRIVTIEPTPSPNAMKVVLDQTLPAGEAYNYKKEDIDVVPPIISQILKIRGVKGIYHVMDFMSIERVGNTSWESILTNVRAVFNDEHQAVQVEEEGTSDHFGEVYVHVQTYRDIPLQVKVFDNEEELRFGLSERFIEAMNDVHSSEVENYILLRKWADYGIRYGEKQEIGKTVLAEIEAAYPNERLREIVRQIKENKEEPVQTKRHNITLDEFEVDEWEKRFQLLDQLYDPTIDDLPLLNRALDDEKMSIRRLATVYLGMIEDQAVIPLVEKALQDKSWAVRRTAGDCMSDLGFTEFEPAAIKALQDKNKLVRWRAAMFLYESGSEQALSALRAAENDPEFEVKLQIKMAIARIEEGEEAKGSIWKQMTETRTKHEE